MKLKELIESGLVKDDHEIAVTVLVCGHAAELRKGNWFNDQIMDVMDREIDTFEYQLGGHWYIELTHKEEEA